ncbi:MAG: hypothetical protein RIQ33_910 [Bacteroidota bacterium]|jgi:threonine/homoserine/homoserine lactone efflux protein
MKSILKLFAISFAISAWGGIPLGILNLTIVEIAANQGVTSALQFALGVVLVELIYVRITMLGLPYFESKKMNEKILQWITACIILLYAAFYFYKCLCSSNSPSNSNIGAYSISFFIWGAALNSINFLQITYWLGWGFVFSKKNILHKKASHTYTYLLGIGGGTLLIFCLFIVGGFHFKSFINQHQSFFYLVTAVILFIISIHLLFKKYLATIFA